MKVDCCFYSCYNVPFLIILKQELRKRSLDEQGLAPKNIPKQNKSVSFLCQNLSASDSVGLEQHCYNFQRIIKKLQQCCRGPY